LKWSVVAVRKRHMYILAAVLLAALATLVCGCVEKRDSLREYNERNNGALAYMKQKYREKFEYVRDSPGGGAAFIPNKGRKILVSCESLPGKEICVHIQPRGKKEIYYDNYMRYHFEDQVNEFVIDIAKSYFDEVTFKESISETQIDSSIDLRTKFEEYILSEYYFVRGSMEVGGANEETIREFAEELVGRGIQFSIGINIPSADEGYSIRYFHEDKIIDFYRRK